jgi:hypothetical protein
MADPRATVVINLRGMDAYRRGLDGGRQMRKVTTQWAARYRAFLQERFVRFSKGGGSWPALAPSTVARRREGGSVAILRDTGTLFAALSPGFSGQPGAFEKHDGLKVTVGFGGPGGHPTAPVSVADLAKFHHFGLGNLPKREIIVKPDAKTLRGMSQDMRRGLGELSDDTKRK